MNARISPPFRTHDQRQEMSGHKWTASWIWHPPREVMENFHLMARRVFEIPFTPSEAVCTISCNSFYDLFINGRYVGRGPSPSYPGAQYYDSYDVAADLRPGENLVAVRCYNFGERMKSVLNQCPGPGGLILELTVDGNFLVATDSDWRVLQDPSREQCTEPITGHRGGFKEYCDGRKELLGWEQQTCFDDSTWWPAHIVAAADKGAFTRLIPREIPPLRVATLAPVDAFFHTCGCAYGGDSVDVIYPEALLEDNDTSTVVRPMRSDFSPSILIDFGRAVFGRFEIDIADGGSGGGIVELSYGESLNLTLIDRYVLRDGAQVYSPIERRGGRYLQLTFRNCADAVRIRRVVCHERSYDVQARGQFSCSDPLLNRIWSVGCETSRAGMQDHFEDCPWREQTLYTGDLVISALLSYYAWGDQLLARKCLRQFARTQRENGEIPPYGPNPQTHFILPEYPACWLISVWHHHLHWNDVELANELWPSVEACLRWYADRRDARGFFMRRTDEPYSRFIDNLSNLESDDDLAAEQMFYCHAIRCASMLAHSIGRHADYERLQGEADLLARHIESVYWSEERQCLLDTIKPVARNCTQITNGLALLWDIVSPTRRSQLVNVLLDSRKAPPVRAGNMSYHMVEALVHAGEHKAALGRIREYWGEMLARGATQFWEVFDPESPNGSWPQRLWSLSHAFCSGPVYSLPAHVAGIRSLAPGFAHVEIAPRLVDLHWVRATVTTPHGEVRVSAFQAEGAHRFNSAEISVPRGVLLDALIELPHRDAWRVSIDGRDVPIRSNQPTLTDEALLRAIHARLVFAEIRSGGALLRFQSGVQPLSVHIVAATGNGPAARRIVVAEVAGDWSAAPPPV